MIEYVCRKKVLLSMVELCFKNFLSEYFSKMLLGGKCIVMNCQIVEQFCLLISVGCLVFYKIRSVVLCRNNVWLMICFCNI